MTARDRQRRRRRRSSDPARIGLVVLGALFGVVIVALGAGVAYIASIASKVPPISQLHPVNNYASSIVYAGNGQRLGIITADVLRTPIKAAEIPPLLKEATVAIEDQRFYQHGGIDPEGILRAAIKDLSSHSALQGGSTITMQLVHNIYLPGAQRDFQIKVKEAVLAERLEKQHTKDWILSDYLNTVPYGTVGGQTAEGVQAAARVFFNRPVGSLTLPQAALLAGLPQAPSDYNPFENPVAATQRRNEVLAKMAQLGYVSQAQAQAAAQAPLELHHGTSYFTTHRENFFFDYVEEQLIQRYGLPTVAEGGLRIYTTINLRLQQEARNTIAHVLYAPGDPASAIVSVDPRNGYIRAMAQSAAYSNSDFNLAAQGHRQAGSTFKTFVLLTALRQGVDPYTTDYTSKALNFTDPLWGHIQIKGEHPGTFSIAEGLMQSNNPIFMQLDLDVGPRNVRQTAIEAGITSPLDGLPAEGLGGLRIGVSPLEMANAYATIADGGWRNTPIAITKVSFPGGRVDNLGRPHRVKVFSDGVTAVATRLLQNYITQGLGTGANYGCVNSGGKTGTTDQNTDAWFVGFTAHLSSSVWIGYPKGKVPMNDVQGIAVEGPTFPATIWHYYMQAATHGDCPPFPPAKQPIVYLPFQGRYEAGSGVFTGSTGLIGAVPTPSITPRQNTSGGTSAPRHTSTPTTPHTPAKSTPPAATPAPTTSGPGPASPGGAAAPHP